MYIYRRHGRVFVVIMPRETGGRRRKCVVFKLSATVSNNNKTRHSGVLPAGRQVLWYARERDNIQDDATLTLLPGFNSEH